MVHNKLLLALVTLSVLTLSYCGSAATQQAVITIDPTVSYQTMTGWEATAQAGQLAETNAITGKSNLNPAFQNYKNQLFDQAVSDLGLTRVRLELLSGCENPVGYFSQYLNGQISYQTYKQNRYLTINDNADPQVINPNGFQFGEIDFVIDNLLLPLKQRLEARGEKLYINLNYVEFLASSFEHKEFPEEYAEYMLAAFLHLQAKYGWVPDAIELALEPDNANFTGVQLGRVLLATGNRLRANGFNPDFVAPSTTCMDHAAEWFDGLNSIAGARQFLTEISYHRYCGVSDQSLQAISDRAVQFGLNTSHLELIGANYRDLHKDLTLGRNSAWAQYTLSYTINDGGDNGGQYYVIDDNNPNAPQVIIGSRTKLLRQYFKYVRPQAIRIKATSTQTSLVDPVAFMNADGKFVTVVKTDASASFAVQGLPAGTYGIKYTTLTQYDVDVADVTITSGQAVNTAIPGPGVLTVYGKTASATASVDAASYTRAVAPGQIVAAFGTGFPAGTNISASATSTPLATKLGGVSVRINNTLAPLFFVGVGRGFGEGAFQINYQLPYEIQPGLASLTVLNNDVPVIQGHLIVSPSAPGVFTISASGKGQAVALNQDSSLNGNPAENPQAKPETRGRSLVLFANGPGSKFVNPANGQALTPVTGAPPASGSTLFATATTPYVTIGGVPANVLFSGLTPGLVGLWQLNITIPANAPTGTAVPVKIWQNGRLTNTTTIAIN